MTPLVERLMPHLVLAPVAAPMLAAAVMLFLGEGRRPAKVVLGAASATAALGASVALLLWVAAHGPVVYVPGGWPAAFGIAVVADRLSALMLVLAWTLGGAALAFGAARWARAGVHFHPLLQLELMGLSGAFLAGDLFNLFVFFEILLAASYGLLLHGSGRPRIRAGLHYVAVNLAASSLFLVGATLLYGVTGTLNLAALSRAVATVSAADRGLVHAGAAVLAVAFLMKAAAWPLNFWLVPAYSAATPPAAALFAVLTKVGVYALFRTSTLLFPAGASPGASYALLVAGTVTAAIAGVAMVGAQRLGHQASLSVIVSAGTLLAALGLGDAAVTGGALFYLVSSALTASALFLLIDLVERWRNEGETQEGDAPFLTPSLEERDVNLDDDRLPLVGVPFPASTAMLGLGFLTCGLLVAGLPPLSGFIGKAAMLGAALGDGGAAVPARAWPFLAVLLGSGFLSLVGMTRSGIRHFWGASSRRGPQVRLLEAVPILVLLGACVALTVAAGPATRYTLAAARALHAPAQYVEAVLGPAGAPPEGRGAP